MRTVVATVFSVYLSLLMHFVVSSMSMAFFIRCYAAKEEEEPYQKLFFPTRDETPSMPLSYTTILSENFKFLVLLSRKNKQKKQKL